MAYLETLPKEDQRYLSSWFGTEVLAGLDDIMQLIRREPSPQARSLMLVSLSNILRSVSWQKVEDLRVRKEVRLDVEIDPKREFLEELGRSVRAVLALLYQEGSRNYPKHTIVQGDARRCAEMWSDVKGKVDAIITSPPYATALPYLDTDRLSLCYLGLLPRPEHRARDLLMIGNREVSEKMRREYLASYQEEKTGLPAAITALIDKIDELNSNHDVGFRRRNLAALLFKYFSDMKRVIQSMNDALRPGGAAYIVVGNNHTTAGGERVDIETAQLLATLADQAGFLIEPSLSMDMLASRDIFRKNAMATEEILYLRKIS
jgi:site-specific DNA-methyltransferase (cytosine-N4-specific)